LPAEGAWVVLKSLTQGWQSSGTVSFTSGAPETVTVGFDVFGDGRGGNDRPNLNNPNAPFDVNGIDGTIFGVPTPPGTAFEVQNFFSCDDVAIICQPPQPIDTFHFLIQSGLGNVGRNTFITPGRQDWNLSVSRSFKLHESHALMFRAEFFNAFNHPNLGINGAGETPDLTLISPNFDNIARTRFGGREIKLWLRYSF
jgi:hypothetical protein